MIVTFIICAFFLILGFSISRNNFFAPNVLTPAIWSFCLLLFLILDHDLPALTWQFYFALIIWIVGICSTSILMQYSVPSRNEEIEVSQTIRDLYFLISLVTFPILIKFAISALLYNDVGTWSLNLRYAAMGMTKHFPVPFSGLFVFIWLIGYSIELYYFSSKNKYRVILLGFFYAAFAFLTMSKGNFLRLFLMSISILYFTKRISLKQIVIGLVSVFFLFTILQSVRHSVDLSSSKAKGDFIVLYMLSSMSAFDTLIPASAAHFGENVFRILYALPFKLGISDIQPVSFILPWILEPIATNTYTGMYPFFIDFGYVGVFLFSIILGLVYGYAYKKAKNNNAMWTLIYAYLFDIIINQYIGDTFITHIVTNTLVLLLFALPFLVPKMSLLSKKWK